jgi:hypothetical protein
MWHQARSWPGPARCAELNDPMVGPRDLRKRQTPGRDGRPSRRRSIGLHVTQRPIRGWARRRIRLNHGCLTGTLGSRGELEERDAKNGPEFISLRRRAGIREDQVASIGPPSQPSSSERPGPGPNAAVGRQSPGSSHTSSVTLDSPGRPATGFLDRWLTQRMRMPRPCSTE